MTDDRSLAHDARAYFAGGCFWGVEYLFQKAPGVISARSGYMGGAVPAPSYEQVCTGRTGHAEAVEVRYDTQVTTYEDMARLFFEIHDPTQADGQGPDIGLQYRSAVFTSDPAERAVIERLMETLRAGGMDVVTRIEPLQTFYPAEAYHQRYYERKGTTPYCHARTPRPW